jgi:hypothetical protein
MLHLIESCLNSRNSPRHCGYYCRDLHHKTPHKAPITCASIKKTFFDTALYYDIVVRPNQIPDLNRTIGIIGRPNLVEDYSEVVYSEVKLS